MTRDAKLALKRLERTAPKPWLRPPRMAQDPLSLLCIEPRFPGRLGAVADWLVRKRGYRCQFY